MKTTKMVFIVWLDGGGNDAGARPFDYTFPWKTQILHALVAGSHTYLFDSTADHANRYFPCWFLPLTEIHILISILKCWTMDGSLIFEFMWRHVSIEARLVSFQFTHFQVNHWSGSRRLAATLKVYWLASDSTYSKIDINLIMTLTTVSCAFLSSLPLISIYWISLRKTVFHPFGITWWITLNWISWAHIERWRQKGHNETPHKYQYYKIKS